MNKQIYPLLIAQFLSAFADNAILFTVIAIVMQDDQAAKWYVPALQSSFLVAFVLLAPWVGGFADHHAKSRVLIVANMIKALGAGLLFMHVEPLFAYCIVGIGAAIYGPAKYGILPELAGHQFLVKANSLVEGSTILAILMGMQIGAKVADYSTDMALAGTIVLFIVSALVTLLLPAKAVNPPATGSKILEFGRQMGKFFTTPRSRFSMLGASLFWATAATLRVLIVAWAPVVLALKNATEIAELTLFLAVGIIAGSALVPRLIPLEHLRRARLPAYLMGLFIFGLSFTDSLWPARGVLFFVGMMGGMFIVPVNAALQELGQLSIGSGAAVALQGFFQNLTMLLAVGGYTFAASQNAEPVISILVLGILVFGAAFLVSWHLPDNQINPFKNRRKTKNY
jgi:LPLT family lysophospholipid transporter-like MFS transporter